MRCVPAPAGARNASRYAYMVVVGPISRSAPRYGTWLYPILALRHALARKGSRADLVVLCALEEGYEQDRMLPEEEALFAGQGIRWRYVPKPRIRGFHMGHYKLWAWQHTEYDRVQLLDADVRAAKESEIPNFKGSDLGRFPLVSAEFWTSDHLSERSRSVDAFSGTRARGTLTLNRR